MKMTFLLSGVALFALGIVTLLILLAKERALAKDKQLAALGNLASGRSGPGRRLAFFLAVIGIGAGACGAFAGVASRDSARRHACENACKERGYARGAIRGSTERDPKAPGRHAFVACACEEGPDPDPLELRASELAF